MSEHRINAMNVGGLPYFNAEIRWPTNNLEVDVLGLVETNINYQKIPADHRLGERMPTWWEHHHLVVSHNTNNKTNSKQG